MPRKRSTPWPRTLATDTALLARVRTPEGRETWFRLEHAPEGYQWHVATPRADGWSISSSGDPVGSLDEALHLNRINLGIGGGQVVELWTHAGREHAVVRALKPPRLLTQDPDAWDEAMREEWEPLGDDLPLDVDVIDPWARINDARVLFTATAKGASEHMILFDEDERAFIPARVLAETSWYSEAGGAPTSWDGGSRLSELYPGMLWSEAWGDTRQEARPVEATGPIQVGAAAAQFILEDDQQFAAAWLLEPFDPEGTLGEGLREEWLTLAGGIDTSVELFLEPGEELPACRESLREDSTYAATAAALADPTSAQGQRLLAILRDVNDTGVIGGIMGYSLGTL